MYCPKCAREIVSAEMEYCPGCGISLGTVRSAVDGGVAGNAAGASKGIRQGVRLILLALVLFPAFVLLSAMFPPNDRLVESSPSSTWFEQIGWAVLWTLALAGAVRIAYALVFERVTRAVSPEESLSSKEINAVRAAKGLPEQREVPIGSWKTSGELFEPVFAKKHTSGELR
jgi:hypothetical protein